jgi:D-xylose transport system substrate-binding protein
MLNRRLILAAAATAAFGLVGTAAHAQKPIVGVSWRHFQEERWKIDEAGLKSVLDKAGLTYIGADAQADPQKQLTDVEDLIAKGAKVLVILAQDSKAIIPAIDRAKAEHIPVIAYDAPIDTTGILFASFDNVAVGHLMAQAMVAAAPKGNYVMLDGDASHTIVQVFREGQMQVLQPLIDKGDIKIVAEQNIDNWKPDVAQAAMEQILTKTGNKVDAVMAMNDGISDGAAAALAAQGLLGRVALSGQDGDAAPLNRIAKVLQTVTIWKNARALGVAAGQAAAELAKGTAIDKVTGAQNLKTASGSDQPAIILTPVAVTRDTLNAVVDAGWISKAKLCDGVTGDAPAACK